MSKTYEERVQLDINNNKIRLENGAEDTFPRRHTSGQETHGKRLDFTSCKGNALRTTTRQTARRPPQDGRHQQDARPRLARTQREGASWAVARGQPGRPRWGRQGAASEKRWHCHTAQRGLRAGAPRGRTRSLAAAFPLRPRPSLLGHKRATLFLPSFFYSSVPGDSYLLPLPGHVAGAAAPPALLCEVPFLSSESSHESPCWTGGQRAAHMFWTTRGGGASCAGQVAEGQGADSDANGHPQGRCSRGPELHPGRGPCEGPVDVGGSRPPWLPPDGGPRFSPGQTLSSSRVPPHPRWRVPPVTGRCSGHGWCRVHATHPEGALSTSRPGLRAQLF